MGSSSDTILSLDLGTTAIKVGLFAASGKLLQMAVREQELLFPQENRVEQSLTHTWELVCQAAGEIFSKQDPNCLVC